MIRREIKRQTRPIIKTAEELTGRMLPKQLLSPREFHLFTSNLQGLFTEYESLAGIDLEKISRDEARLILRRLVNRQFSMIGSVPKGKDALVWLRRGIERALKELERTKFGGISLHPFLDATGWLISALSEPNAATRVQSFLGLYLQSEDASEVAQAIFNRYLPQLETLERINKHKLEGRNIQKLIDLYQDFSALYENLGRVVIMLNGLRLGRDLSFAAFRKKQLWDIQRTLRREEKLRILADGIDRTIRNSAAHGSVIVLHRQKRIKFRDMNRELDLRWPEFRTATSNLAAVLLCLTFGISYQYLLNMISILDDGLRID